MSRDQHKFVEVCSCLVSEIFLFAKHNESKSLSYLEILNAIRVFFSTGLDSSDTYSWLHSEGYQIEDFCSNLTRQYCDGSGDIKIVLFCIDFLLSVLEYNELIHNCNFKDSKA